MTEIYTAMTVSALSITVIFLVLSILIGVIKIMVHFVPYKEGPAPQDSGRPSGPNLPDEEITAAIHAALAFHLGKSPHEIQIANIKSL